MLLRYAGCTGAHVRGEIRIDDDDREREREFASHPHRRTPESHLITIEFQFRPSDGGLLIFPRHVSRIFSRVRVIGSNAGKWLTIVIIRGR